MSKELYNKAAVWDIEANNWLEGVTEIHCVAISWNCDATKLYTGSSVPVALERLAEQPCIVGHNIEGYDIPVIQKLYPTWKPKGIVRDTLIMSRLQRVHQMKEHSLEAWGRLKRNFKGDFKGPWDKYTDEMGRYCVQDTTLNVDVWLDLIAEDYPEQAIELEHKFAKVLRCQMQVGTPFDVGAAKIMEKTLRKRYEELHGTITQSFPSWEKRSVFVPKRDNKTLGYKKDVPVTKVKTIPFNPGSRDQVVKFLKQTYKWTPVDFTEKNNPKIGGDILNKLPYKEAPLLAEYFDHKKLLGQLADGKAAWLKLAKGGRIHGYVNHNGAVTGRCTHSKPNMAQVPRTSSFMGVECRSLIYAPIGHSIVGCDASGLELRNLAHYLASYDDGTYAKIVEEGDVHTENQMAAGLPTRDDAKTFIYAHNYGAGDAKLGSIVKPAASIEEMKMTGRTLRAMFMTKIVGLQELIGAVKGAATRRGYLIGLDGRKIWIRSEHKALNSLLQGAGSVIMKQATVNLWEMYDESGLTGCYPILHVHDEFQSVVPDECVEAFKALCVSAIERTTEQFNYRCKLTGEAKHGQSWADTH